MSNKKMITLKSSDGVTLSVEEAVALESQTIKRMIEDGCGVEVPLPNVTGEILAKVIEYCKKHVEFKAAGKSSSPTTTPSYSRRTILSPADKELKKWDAEFVNVDWETLHDIILAAHYLQVMSLLDLTCQTVADIIEHSSPEQMREMFKIENNLTPEEVEEIRREPLWAFE